MVTVAEAAWTAGGWQGLRRGAPLLAEQRRPGSGRGRHGGGGRSAGPATVVTSRSSSSFSRFRDESGDGQERGGDGKSALKLESRRLWEMQRELLLQIEERKRLHAELLQSINEGRLPADAASDLVGSSAARLQTAQNSLDKLQAEVSSSESSTTSSSSRGTATAVQSRSRSSALETIAPPSSPIKPQTAPPQATPSTTNARSSSPATGRRRPPAPRPAEIVSPPPAPAPAPAPVAQAAPPPAPEKKEPLAGPNVMNIVIVASECAPWSKTGGLGDVVGSLPKALARRGHRVMVVAPRYSNYDVAWDTGVRRYFDVDGQSQEVGYFQGYKDGVDFVFVDHACFHNFAHNIYGGTRQEVQSRCILLCKAAIEAPWHVPCGGVVYGDENLIFIANDWHTALLPVYLQAYYRDHGLFYYARAVLIIHNIAHQGRGPMAEFERLGLPEHYRGHFYLDDPFGGVHMNIFMAGLISAHRIVAVSHGYAWECQTQDGGWGLDHVMREHSWKLRGIVNGVDTSEWDPATDVFLQNDGYQNFTAETLKAGKAACKAALQRELGLPERPDVPMLGFIGRLDYQKGVDIIQQAQWWLMQQDIQLVMLGTGRQDLEEALRSMESHNREKVRSWVGFSVQVAHRITAAADLLLMPSRFEPCGLNQLYAMRYGTVPVVHSVGGLRDTVQPFDPYENRGSGWSFEKAEPQGLIDALGNALYTFRSHRDSFRDIQLRGMAQDLSWDHAAELYEQVLVDAKFQW
eukprot:jgi/Chlat1/4336/Chrsp29S04501